MRRTIIISKLDSL